VTKSSAKFEKRSGRERRASYLVDLSASQTRIELLALVKQFRDQSRATSVSSATGGGKWKGESDAVKERGSAALYAINS